MNDDQLDEIKQSIKSTVAETEEHLKEFIQATVSLTETRIKKDLVRIEKKVEDGFAGIADAATISNEETDERLDKVEARLNVLEAA